MDSVNELIETVQEWADLWRNEGQETEAEIADKVANLLLSQAQEIERLRKALTHIAAYDDELASARLAKTGRYGAFDEPGSVKIAREALDNLP